MRSPSAAPVARLPSAPPVTVIRPSRIRPIRTASTRRPRRGSLPRAARTARPHRRRGPSPPPSARPSVCPSQRPRGQVLCFVGALFCQVPQPFVLCCCSVLQLLVSAFHPSLLLAFMSFAFAAYALVSSSKSNFMLKIHRSCASPHNQDYHSCCSSTSYCYCLLCCSAIHHQSIAALFCSLLAAAITFFFLLSLRPIS